MRKKPSSFSLKTYYTPIKCAWDACPGVHGHILSKRSQANWCVPTSASREHLSNRTEVAHCLEGGETGLLGNSLMPGKEGSSRLSYKEHKPVAKILKYCAHIVSSLTPSLRHPHWHQRVNSAQEGASETHVQCFGQYLLPVLGICAIAFVTRFEYQNAFNINVTMK